MIGDLVGYGLSSVRSRSYWYSRFLLERALIYLVAFIVAANQFVPLLGEYGLLPVSQFIQAAAGAAVWAALWALYLSFVNVGQIFYEFGWETLLLEAGFLAIFAVQAEGS